MAHTYDELKGKTVDDLREIAKGLGRTRPSRATRR